MNTEPLLQKVNQRIDNLPAQQCKDDMRQLITSLIAFTNENDDRILDPATPADELPKCFFKLIVNLGLEAGIAQMSKKARKAFEEKVDPLMALWPMLQRYADTSTEDTNFQDVKNELPADDQKLIGNE